MFPIIHIFGRDVGSYALLAFCGLFVCGAVIFVLCKNLKITVEDISIIILVVSAGLLIGGHLLYGIVNINQIIEIFKKIGTISFKEAIISLANSFGGMVFYGGLFGGLCALKIYSQFSKLEYRRILFDIYAFSIPLFHFFGRIGCFFAGCCYGIESKFGFIVNDNHLVPEINNVRRFPISLVEAFFNLIIFGILIMLFKKNILKNKLIYIYMLLYSVVRFCTEFLRGDTERGIYYGLSTSQWISICLFTVAGVSLYIKSKCNNKAKIL